MTEKISRFIVKHRWWILAIALLLTAASVTTIGKARINYDITAYLDKDSVTRRSLDVMQEEFGSIEQLAVMVDALDAEEMSALAARFAGRPDVMRASYEQGTDDREADGRLYRRMTLFTTAEDPVEFVKEVENILREELHGAEFWLSGSATQMLRIQRNIAEEMPLALLIAVGVVIGVLLLSSHSFFEPVIFILVLIMSILMNMGTNWIFPDVSFITFAVAPILQLALAMDYSIMLLHGFFRFRGEGKDDEEALELALRNAFMPIISSSLTTVAGLTALMFMTFTIGFDIGIVLAKGILISMLSVFTVMPAFVMMFSKVLRRTMHRPLPLGGRHIGRLANRVRKVLPFVLILVIFAAGYLQTKNEYVYSEPENEASRDMVGEVFGKSNQLVLLLPGGESNEDYDTQRRMVERLQKIEFEGHPAIVNVTAMITTGEAAIREYTAAEVAELLDVPGLAASFYFGSMGFGTSARGDLIVEKAAEIMTANQQIQELKETLDFAKAMFLRPNCARIILLLDIPTIGGESSRVVEEICEVLKEFYPDSRTGVVGTAMSSYEICQAFKGDMLRVSIITILAVFLIIMISFRSLVIPALLVCVIQGAIWIAMSMSYVMGEAMFFMCYLVCLTIQMGATIDYGILTTENYKKARLTLAPHEAIVQAMTMSMPTVFTSGVILVVASFVIGKVCSVYYIFSIGQMLARGALVSVLLILLLLPPMLVNLDKLIVKKTK